VFSQSCSVFFWVVSLRLRIISLMLSFSFATSPCASTAIERVRSPFVTAVDTSAMARTWFVRLAARPFTLSVKSRHVPAAAGTFAARSVRLPPAFAFPTDLARAGTPLTGKRWERVGHVIDSVSEFCDLALRSHGQFPFQIAGGHRRHYARDAANLICKVAGHR